MIKAEGESCGKPEVSAQLGQELRGAMFPANMVEWWAVVRKDPALLLDREFPVKAAWIKGVMECMASPAPAWGHPCSQGQGTFSAHKVAAGELERGNCLEIPTKLRGHPHPYTRFHF